MSVKFVPRRGPGRITVASLVALQILACLFLPWAALAQSLAARELVVENSRQERHRFVVEVATTPEGRAKGLMFRRELAPDAGMLFDFGKPEMVVMWMKNTLLPLDMLFVAEGGKVVNIAERTVPGSLAPVSSEAPVKFVLEVNGGTAQRLHLKAGDRIIKGLQP